MLTDARRAPSLSLVNAPTLPPPSTMSNGLPGLPYDLWSSIAEFVPREHLKKLIPVNKAFYDAGMNARYRNATFTHFDPPKMLQTLQRLRHPDVCFRVRALEFTWLLRSLSECPAVPGTPTSVIEMEDLVKAMIRTLDFLPNITEYTVEWRRQSTFQSISIPFLVAAWARLGPKLRKVTVKAVIDTLRILLPLCMSLPCVEHLDITIRHSTGMSMHTMTVSNAVAPFINLSARTLQRLSLSTWTHEVPLSVLYPLLAHFPHLQHLSVNLTLVPSAYQGFDRFLLNHAATLKHFIILPNRCPWIFGHVAGWMNECATQDVILTNLVSLHAPCPRSSLNLETIAGCLRRSADTLTSLTLSDCALSEREVDVIVDLFAHRGKRGLEFLSLDVAALTAELINRFACSLPGLHTLYLTFPSFEAFLPVYPDWKLVDIGLAQKPCTRIGRDTDFMRLFAQHIPSIRYFWGLVR
jgi:hypothetical protein